MAIKHVPKVDVLEQFMSPISNLMDGRNNNFNLLRLLAAIFIAYYHCYFMALGPAMDEKVYVGLYELSQITLNFFFITSGFLIALSFTRRSSLFSYFVARIARLIPGLFILSLLICFVMGPLVTNVSLSEYFLSLKTWLYVPLTTALQPDRTLPGVFTNNINPNEIDAALWTLRYEMICYVGLAALGVLGLLTDRVKFFYLSIAVLVAFLGITFLTNLREIAAVNHLMHFGLSFFIGTFAFVYRDKIPLHWGIALLLSFAALLMYMTLPRSIAEPVIILATAYFVFWLAYVPRGALLNFNKLGDYSYGVYIYHYPIEQLLMQFIGGFSPLTLFLITLPLSLVCAVLSWTFIERPSLNLVRKQQFTSVATVNS